MLVVLRTKEGGNGMGKIMDRLQVLSQLRVVINDEEPTS